MFTDASLDRLITNTVSVDMWLALWTAMPTISGGGTEASHASYSRAYVQRYPYSGTWDFPSTGVAENGTDIFFPEVTGSWGTILGWSLMLTSELSTPEYYVAFGEFTSPQIPAVGDTPYVPTGIIQLSIANLIP